MLVPIIYSWVSQLIDAYWLIEHCYPYETGTSPMLFPTACPFKPPCVKDLPLLRLIKTWYFWLVVEPTPLKNDGVRQWGWWHSHTSWKNNPNVPNHQPDDFIKSNLWFVWVGKSWSKLLGSEDSDTLYVVNIPTIWWMYRHLMNAQCSPNVILLVDMAPHLLTTQEL